MAAIQTTEDYQTDILIVGGGASGLAAAVTAARANPDAGILVLDRCAEPGRKILATGNGRCNLTNQACGGAHDTIRFFASLGVPVRTDEDGRVYPYSEDARAVRDALVRETACRGVRFFCAADVQAIRCAGSGFEVAASPYDKALKQRSKSDKLRSKQEAAPGKAGRAAGSQVFLDGGPAPLPLLSVPRTFRARRVLLAAGGKAGPAFGTTGAGAGLARALGLPVTRLAPALTAVELSEDVRAAAGCRAKAALTLSRGKQRIAVTSGELQFTPYGISGICVFDLSRFLVPADGSRRDLSDYRIWIDLLPDGSPEDAAALVRHLLQVRKDRSEAGPASGAHPDQYCALLTVEDLAPVVRRGIGTLLLQRTGGRPDETARILKEWAVTPKDLKGWDMAQVTKGGVPLEEVWPDTLESRRVPGLHLSGEVLDYDGPCGGFNLQHAWETGISAGRAMADSF